MAVDEQLWRQIQAMCAGAKVQRLPAMIGVIDGLKCLITDFGEIMLRPDKPGDSPIHADTNTGANGREADWCKREFGEEVVMVDGNLRKETWAFVFLHEIVEWKWMKKGDSYNAAHKKANAMELELRRKYYRPL